MTIHLVTGRAGEAHVTSVDAGKFNANVFGRGRYVLDGCECTVIDSNNLSIAEGVMLVDGRQVNIEGTGEPVVIENGQSGYNRIDLVCLRYQRSEGIETIDISTIKGQPTSGEPVAPTGSGSILDGDALAYIPIFSVRITGTNVEQPIMLLESFALDTLGFGEEIPAGADLNDYKTVGKYYIDLNNLPNVENVPNIIAAGGSAVVTVEPFAHIKNAVIQRIKHSASSMELKRSYSPGASQWGEWMVTSGADAIYTEGESNGWHWIKYANGTAILSTKTQLQLNVVASWTNFFVQGIDRIAFPFTLMDAPVETTSIKVDGANVWIMSGYLPYATTTSYSYVVAPTPTTGFQATIDYVVIGRWK